VHRGGALSAGKAVNGEVQCPYHGWRFDGGGACTAIPAQPGVRVPGRARVDAYPVVERYGWIWAFLGDLPEAERPPLPDLSWVDDPQFRIVRGHFDWRASWDRIIENGLDFSHAAFVHGTAFGDPDAPEIGAFEVESDDWSGSAMMTMRRPVRRGWPRRKPTGEHVDVVTRPGFHLSGPCTTLQLEPRDGWRIQIVSAHVPVDAERTRTWWIMGRTFMRSPLFDGFSRRSNLRIFEQDRVVLERIRPERVPQTWQEEVSVKSDALQIAFRRRIQALEKRGWAIDDDRLQREFSGRRAAAIACPARKAAASWAIPAVPLRELR